jgi:hypothetical protein
MTGHGTADFRLTPVLGPAALSGESVMATLPIDEQRENRTYEILCLVQIQIAELAEKMGHDLAVRRWHQHCGIHCVLPRPRLQSMHKAPDGFTVCVHRARHNQRSTAA